MWYGNVRFPGLECPIFVCSMVMYAYLDLGVPLLYGNVRLPELGCLSIVCCMEMYAYLDFGVRVQLLYVVC